MKCLEREKLFEYVHRMLEPQEAEAARQHLTQCGACRAMLAEYERLDGVLTGWKAPEPSPWFEARLRAHLAAEKEGGIWGTWGFLEWRRWLLPATVVALAVLAIMIAIQLPREPQPVANQDAPRVVAPAPRVPEKTAPEETMRAQAPPRSPARVPVRTQEEDLAADEGFSALDDYELVANFDVLSELSRGGQHFDN
jgi:hypothetical protein